MTKVAVRDGKLVVPTCPECECRLEKHTTNGNYFHYRKWAYWVKKDARGCSCSLLAQRFAIIEGRVTPIWV